MTSTATGPGAPRLGHDPRPALVPVLLAVNVAVWVVYSLFAFAGSALHQDMTEAYVWGREFQLGYYKHPPLWAWIAGAWFSFMPQRDWAFYLLSMLNANLGLLGAWKLIGCFAGGERRLAATLLLLLTPFYTFLAFKYNANSIFLSLWPWTAYFFLRSVDEARPAPSVLFGLFAAASILSKYFAVVLLASCLIALFFHPGWRRYLASPRPYLAIGVCILLVAPHIWWLFATGFLPFHYFAGELAPAFPDSLVNAAAFLGGCLGMQAGVIVAVLLMKPDSLRRLPGNLRRRWQDPRFRVMTVLAVGPAILAALACPLTHVRLDTNMAIGIFCLFPLLVMEIAGVSDARRIRRTAWLLALGLILVALGISPFAARESFRQGQPTFTDPRREVALEAARIWHRQTGQPLRIVSGDGTYAGAVAFYDEDRPRELIDFNFAYSPWLRREDVRRRGLLAICEKGDTRCLDRALAFGNPGTTQQEITLSHEFAGEQTAPKSFVLVIAPPSP